MKSWGIAIISIGCISIMSGPALMDNYITMLVQGFVLVMIGYIMYRKSKSKKQGGIVKCKSKKHFM